jgi:rare lipoprotein A
MSRASLRRELALVIAVVSVAAHARESHVPHAVEEPVAFELLMPLPEPPPVAPRAMANNTGREEGSPIAGETGAASYYGPGFVGRRTANGETFDPRALTMAHPTLPFGTLVRVTNLINNKTVTVRVNDRGPFTGGRIADLSAGAAALIDMLRAGVARVRLEVFGADAMPGTQGH